MKLQQKVDTDPKCHRKRYWKLAPDHPQSRYHVCAVANPIWRQELEKGKDLFPYLKMPLDVRCLGMKLNYGNIISAISAELPTIYDPKRFLFLR